VSKNLRALKIKNDRRVHVLVSVSHPSVVNVPINWTIEFLRICLFGDWKKFTKGL
jgi:hypothetical protein